MKNLQQKYNTIVEVDRVRIPELLDRDKYPGRRLIKVDVNRPWSPAQYIDSLLGYVPGSPLVFNDVDGVKYLVDGEKRIKAIRDFFSDKFPYHGVLFDELEGLTYSCLPYTARQILQNRRIPIRTLLNAHEAIISAIARD